MNEMTNTDSNRDEKDVCDDMDIIVDQKDEEFYGTDRTTER